MDPAGTRYEPLDPAVCWTCRDWLGYMMRMRDTNDDGILEPAYFTPGDPKTDGDVSGHPGYWLNYDAQQHLVGLIGKKDCRNPQGALQIMNWPRAVEKIVACPPVPGPTPTPPAPGPTPVPPTGSCPTLLKVGGMFLSAVSCAPACTKAGYLGVRVNYTATELCKEGDAGCVCDPARNRCEMPTACQNPLGAATFITLEGRFTNDICDENSDNHFNCHHKPLPSETGVTLFTSVPQGPAPNPWDARGTTNCVDVQLNGTKPLDKNDARCLAAKKAAGR